MANSCQAQLARYLPGRVHRTDPVAGRRTGHRGPAACRRSAYLRFSRDTSRHPEAINHLTRRSCRIQCGHPGSSVNLTNAVRIIRSPHAAAGLPRTLRTPITRGAKYFDVTGATPDSVVYNDGARDLAVWLTPPPAPPAPAAGGSVPYRGTPSASSPAQDTEAAPAAVPPAAETPMTPAPASVGTPLTPGSVGTPLPTGSAGTPLPTGAVAPGGTPAPAGSPSVTTTPDISTGTPLPAETPAPATAPTATPAGSAGTPLPAPEVAPAAGAGTPAAPVTTTPVPMP